MTQTVGPGSAGQGIKANTVQTTNKGAVPRTLTQSEARALTNWNATPAGGATPYTYQDLLA